ncbi:hypothetical protein E8E13_009546 [Curvularia kusanoi]|uniref:Uncharacterized protein n=1 Tax=Curvularia kusanoi TaxID=90978 RepID=A0A9P4WDU8_CURKU|nr:hypothetical protein E8E13_009546 [Curvularia kusanoi]
MVYRQHHAVDTACRTDLDSLSHMPIIEACQQDAKAPFCWPPNGSRICMPNGGIPFHWPSRYYQGESVVYINFGSRGTSGPHANSGTIYNTFPLDYIHYPDSEDIPGGYATSIEITITEHRTQSNGSTQIIHRGPTLLFKYKSPSFTTENIATRGLVSGRRKKKVGWSASLIMGVVFGGILGVFFLPWLLIKCCKTGCWSGCLGCLGPDRYEIARVKRQEERRIRAERAARQPQVDAIKASVARGEIWNGPVQSGGPWVIDMPQRPSTAVSRASRASIESDGIRPVGGGEQQNSRLEDQRIEQHRLELARAGETEPPAYDASPPKYTP